MTDTIPTAEATPLINPPPHRDCPAPPDPESTLVAAVRAGPSGLGTAAAHLARDLTQASDPGPGYLERPWGTARSRRCMSRRSSGWTTRWPPRWTTA